MNKIYILFTIGLIVDYFLRLFRSLFLKTALTYLPYICPTEFPIFEYRSNNQFRSLNQTSRKTQTKKRNHAFLKKCQTTVQLILRSQIFYFYKLLCLKKNNNHCSYCMFDI